MSKQDRKDTVMSFRVPAVIKAWLNKDLDRDTGKPIVGVPSANRYCRKIVLDYVSGRLAYANPADRDADPDVATSEGVGPAATGQ